MKVAAIQLNAGEKKSANIAKALRLTQQAIRHKAQLIVLPEVFNYRGKINRDMLKDVAETIPGESVTPFLHLAKAKKVFILPGSIYEMVQSTRKVYNTSILINDQGKVCAKYQKMHLFKAIINKNKIDESRDFMAGTRPIIADIKGFRLGMSICYDVRFPGLYQRYYHALCNIIVVSSSFTKKTGAAHWEILLRARAIENLCYVIAPNQTGKVSKNIVAYGNSMIIGPWGEVLARASGDKEEIIYADIKKSSVLLARRKLPSFNK